MDEMNLPEGQDGLNEEDVEALLRSFGGSETPPAEGGGESPESTQTDRIIRQEDIDELLTEGIHAGKEALGTDRELIAKAAGPRAGGGKDHPVDIDLLVDVPLKVKIELGRNNMSLENILNLRESSIVELDKLAGDPLDILVNDRLVARGEVLVLNDNFCIRITEVVNPEERKKK